MQKDSTFFDDLARMASGAAGAMNDVRREIDSHIAGQLERWMQKMHFVTREEYDTLLEMLVKSRAEQESLSQRLAELEKSAQ